MPSTDDAHQDWHAQDWVLALEDDFVDMRNRLAKHERQSYDELFWRTRDRWEAIEQYEDGDMILASLMLMLTHQQQQIREMRRKMDVEDDGW